MTEEVINDFEKLSNYVGQLSNFSNEVGIEVIALAQLLIAKGILTKEEILEQKKKISKTGKTASKE